MDITASKSTIKSGIKSYNGLYRAYVEDNEDPKMLGRVKIRIYAIHGTKENGISNKNLPFASVVSPFASNDSGQYLVPEIGTVGYVMFEEGNIDYPVFLGGFFTEGRKNPNEIGTLDDIREQPTDTSDTPVEVYNPNTKVLMKTPKGASIIFEDNNGMESMAISNPLGESFFMEYFLKEEKARGNKFKEDTPKEFEENSHFDSISKPTKIGFKTLTKSEFSISSEENSTVMAYKGTGDNDIEFRTTSGKGTSEHLIRVTNGGNSCFIKMDENIQLFTDSAMIEIRGSDILIRGGAITINGSSLTINAPTKINSTLNVSSNVTAEGDVKASGISLKNHKHGGVTNGNGYTKKPE